MNGWKNYLHQFIIAIEKSASNSGQWRLIGALAILVIGLFLLEIVFRRVRQRIHVSLEKQGRDPAAWNISAMLPAVRLAATAWLLRLAESVVMISEQLSALLHAVQGLLLALAVIVAVFWLVGRLQNLRLALPDGVQERFPEELLAKLNRLLRLTTLLGVAAVFVYSQRMLLPVGLWQYSHGDIC